MANGGNSDKIPTAFIVTGPNIASQKLLFEQLSEDLGDICRGRFVRIQSAEAPNLKSTLKKIIRDVTARATEDEDEQVLAVRHDVSSAIHCPVGSRTKIKKKCRAVNILTMTSKPCLHSFGLTPHAVLSLPLRMVKHLMAVSYPTSSPY